MVARLPVKPLTRSELWANKKMVPLMQLLIGDPREAPQETHPWNNTKLRPEDVADFRSDYMLRYSGDPDAVNRWLKGCFPHFHITIAGGWRKFVVIKPTKHVGDWHVGWIADDVIGVSRIRLDGPVRLLIGPGETTFLGVSAYNYVQLPLQQTGSGHLGDGGPFRSIRLL